MMIDKFGVQDEIKVELIKNTLKTRKIIAVGGVPGSGKTTLFRKYMEDKSWTECAPAKLVVASYNTDRDLYVLGKYDEGETFAGTDRLSMAVQPPLQEWIASHNCNILFEGDPVIPRVLYGSAEHRTSGGLFEGSKDYVGTTLQGSRLRPVRAIPTWARD
jgi:hypothetical protein